jgi:transposase
VTIDHTFFYRIKDLLERGLTPAQAARELGLDPRTVRLWARRDGYAPRRPTRRASKLDPYKETIVRMLERHPYSCAQILREIRVAGYPGGKSVLADYIRKVRPVRRAAFLKLDFQPGDAAQADWGSFGSVQAGNATRRLSFFVMVLCHSRLMYVLFTLGQAMEHFLDAHQKAFAFFGAVPRRLIVDNLKSAVLLRPAGEAPVLHPRYRDFADHYGFKIVPCGVRKPHEKGIVENSVGYLKKNFLAGLAISDFKYLNPSAEEWLRTTANIRLHATTGKLPVELFQQEKPFLLPLSTIAYDCGVDVPVQASSQFRVRLDQNTYSVPHAYAGARLRLRRYPGELRIFHEHTLIASHQRSYERKRDCEHPDHPKALLLERRQAREQQLLKRFLALCPEADAYHHGLAQKRLNAALHVRKIVALSEIYGAKAAARAIADARVFEAFSSEYIANLLEQRARKLPEPGALHLTRSADLLELELPPPNLGLYQPQPKGEIRDQGPQKSSP